METTRVVPVWRLHLGGPPGCEGQAATGITRLQGSWELFKVGVGVEHTLGFLAGSYRTKTRPSEERCAFTEA